jgi:hypothetical protein
VQSRFDGPLQMDARRANPRGISSRLMGRQPSINYRLQIIPTLFY